MSSDDVDRYIGTFECERCGLRVRLSTFYKVGSVEYECRRCSEETAHALTNEPVLEKEAESYV